MKHFSESYAQRESGLLMPFRAMPGDQDYQGTTGKDAIEFLEIMQKAGFTILHDLPNTPPDAYDCPYSSVSAFALDPQRIDLEQLATVGDLRTYELDDYQRRVAKGEVGYTMRAAKQELLGRAYLNFIDHGQPERQQAFAQWREQEAEWLEPYAAYEVLSRFPQNQNKRWQDWEAGKDYSPALVNALKTGRGQDFAAVCYMQWVAEQQNATYMQAAERLGIEVWSDVPFYVGPGEVWANREIFNLNPDGTQIDQGGAPPSATSAIGQLWGNATYKVDYENNLPATDPTIQWWVKRLSRASKLTSGKVRLDHFIGFAEPYIIAADAVDGTAGWRVEGMGSRLFDPLVNSFGQDMPFYPEDLGTMTDATPELRDKYNLLSTSLAVRGLTKQLLLGDYDVSNNNPDNYNASTVAFSGNHDSPTLIHAMNTVRANHPREFAGYINRLRHQFPEAKLHYDTPSAELAPLENIRVVESMGRYAFLAMWDVLGTEAVKQYNVPNTIDPNNWVWRMDSGDTRNFAHQAAALRSLNEASGRTLRPAA